MSKSAFAWIAVVAGLMGWLGQGISDPVLNGSGNITQKDINQPRSIENASELFVSSDLIPEDTLIVAKELTIEVDEDTRAMINLAAIDELNQKLEYTITKHPLHGKIYGLPPYLEYLPANDYFGEDRFEYVVKSGTAKSSPAAVTIRIIPVNDAPQIKNHLIESYKSAPVAIQMESDDLENDLVIYRVTRFPLHGTLQATGSVYKYTPSPSFVGEDSFLYVGWDGISESQEAEVKIVVKETKHSMEIEGLLKSVGIHGGVALGDYKNPDHIFQSDSYVPASIIKMVITLAALHRYGAEKRFKTDVYLDEKRNLYLKGYGDPSLTTKEWHKIAKRLEELGVFTQTIEDIILDDYAFVDGIDFEGRSPTIDYFNAPVGALATNYNTVTVRKRGKKHIAILRKNTPVTEIVLNKAKGLPNGVQRFSVAKDSLESTYYTGELVKAIFVSYGAEIIGKQKRGKVITGLAPIVEHYSEPILYDVLVKMLRESNNFIANQLLLSMAVEEYGEAATISQGVDLITSFMTSQLKLRSVDFNLVEGSGLSRKNRVDLVTMLNIVTQFKVHRDMLPRLEKSKYRDLVEIGRRWNIRAKSGTMKGISNLAGYIQLKDKQWKPFVIMLKDDVSDRGRVMEIIGRYYDSSVSGLMGKEVNPPG